ncbi:hypothetical protein MTBLM5_30015 [Magnetospirillum sp. LM-5]|uniref:glycosyltransferase n=1 Tax=Magnetospirillum sp. LM-5 TaxID=2681466 RepID=UPI0013848FDC|nr:glycosyltransferase [Magnetospirillum sp. LM-5]CAA7619092.1 hypothetical protein MTBLM5_30015 [Magnetospirillum sp. LM-5]
MSWLGKCADRLGIQKRTRNRIIRGVWMLRHPASLALLIAETLHVLIRPLIRPLAAWIGFNIYRHKPRELRSVLQVSLSSHKQYMLSRLLRRHGIRSSFLAVNTTKNDRLTIGYDYSVPMNTNALFREIISAWLLWTVMARYDIIHYHFNAFLFQDGYDLDVLRRLGKGIVIHYRGCDLRSREVNLSLRGTLNACAECDYPEGSCDNPGQRQLIDLGRRYGDHFYVTTPDLLDFMPTAEHLPFVHPVEVDFDAIAPLPRNEGLFRIVTSSNHAGVDGVSHIRAAVNRLQREGYAVELIEVIKQTYREAIAAYKSADLYVGKLLMGYYNNANIETMMLGVPNISYIRPEYIEHMPECPIIIADPANVYPVLKEWLDKPDELKAVGLRGPDYVHRYHNPDLLTERVIEKYKSILAAKQ